MFKAAVSGMCFGPLLVLLASCGSQTAALRPADRVLVSPTWVKTEVGLPETIQFVDPEGAGVIEAGHSRQTVQATLGERADKGSLILLDEFVGALETRGIRVVEAGESSDMILRITELGLLPATRENLMQFKLTVDATLATPSGRVIWEQQRGTVPYNASLPIRHIKDYKQDNGLVRKDFAVVCRHVADQLVADLKSQMVD